MSEWKRYKLSDLYEMSSGISSTKEQAGHGSPFLSFSVVFNNYFLPDSLIDLMDTTEGDKQKYSINEGDIFLTRTSETVDELAMSSVALKDYPEASFSGFLKRLRPVDKRIVYPKFMAFYLRSPLFRRTIINNTVMTLRASFNEAMFSYLEIMLPDFDTQKKIGDFLYSLEKKKQINNQINQELEAMAKTLYDYWFVQFDFPYQNGNPYKSSGGKMVYHPELKREIPEGWGNSILGEFADLYQPKTISDKDMIEDGEYLVYGANGIIGRYSEYNHEDSMVTISCRGNCGIINITRPYSWITGNSMVVKPKDDIYNIDYISNLLLSLSISSVITGSVQKQLTRTSLVPLKVIIPNKEIIEKYRFITKASFEKRKSIQIEVEQLTQLRDWLLPMLMNGQVKVENYTD